MKVNIKKGTNQIGGCITEIQSENARIIIDFGEDLPDGTNKKKENPMIDGLTTGKPKYDAVFITHSHGDHIGLIDYILDDIPVFVEPESKKIYDLLCAFTYQNARKNTKNMEFEKTITIKDMKITLYIIDHSSYNSGMILIESNGKKILHTGDYRNHGRKGKIFQNTLEKIGTVDLLITEGTSFGREDITYQTEEELEKDAKDIFKKYNQLLILQSSTNIDRIVSFYKACKSTNKVWIEDLFTANITMALSNTIPNPKTFRDVYVFIPRKYQRKEENFQNHFIKPLKKYSNSTVLFRDFGMMVKTSMLEDIRMLKEKGALTNACLIYSMWEGYLQEESFQNFIEEIKKLDIDFKVVHTSGHADIRTIRQVGDIINPKRVIPIHTENKEKAKELFQNAVILDDNEEIEI